jgi:chorismate mutase
MKNQKVKFLNIKRKQIDEIDKKLLELLAKRFKINQKIGFYKKANKLKIKDKKREREILKRVALLAKKLNLNQNLIKKIFKEIIKESCQLQKR